MKLNNLQKAIFAGAVLTITRDPDGLRIVCLNKDGKQIAYGEHPHVEEALAYANLDMEWGGLAHERLYGEIFHKHTRGASESNTPLDQWVNHNGSISVEKIPHAYRIAVTVFNADKEPANARPHETETDVYEALYEALQAEDALTLAVK